VSSRLQPLTLVTRSIATDLPVLSRRAARGVAQGVTQLARTWVLEVAIWRSSRDPALQASLRSLWMGLDGVRWGDELEAVRRWRGTSERPRSAAELTRIADTLSAKRVRRFVLRIVRGMFLGTGRRAALRRLKQGRWPELRPGREGSQLSYLVARSVASSGVRACVLDQQTQNITKALRQIAVEPSHSVAASKETDLPIAPITEG
jgi:hypothetical protein